MPQLYLQPMMSSGAAGETEKECMYGLTDAIELYLRASGIRFARGRPLETAEQAVEASKSGECGCALHLALRFAAGDAAVGAALYFSPDSVSGQRAAELLADTLKQMYSPGQVRIRPAAQTEGSGPADPGVLLEIPVPEHSEESAWLRKHAGAMARHIVRALTAYFDIPLIEPETGRTGVVDTARGNLHIRAKPSMAGAVLDAAPNGSQIQILGRWQDWYVVEYNGQTGYASSRYIRG